jgi:hypothetical protein
METRVVAGGAAEGGAVPVEARAAGGALSRAAGRFCAVRSASTAADAATTALRRAARATTGRVPRLRCGSGIAPSDLRYWTVTVPAIAVPWIVQW